MARVLYLDCFSGAAGDMIAGALVDAGVPFEELARVVGSLGLEGVRISHDRVDRSGIGAAKFRVETGTSEHVHAHDHARVDTHAGADTHADAHEHHHAHSHSHEHGESHAHGHAHERAHSHQHEHEHHHAHSHSHEHEPGHEHEHAGGHAHASGEDHHEPHRSLSQILRIVERSSLSSAGTALAGRLFRRLAEVEAAIHRMPVEEVHLHEVGAVDSIVDIVCAVRALEWLAPARVVASPLNVGAGTVKCAHGEMPVPAPATAALLAGAPTYAAGPAVELTTPTGALIVAEYADAFGPMPPMRVERIGYGAGDRDLPGRPNVLRALVGESAPAEAGAGAAAGAPAAADAEGLERVVVLECQIDDMNPQLYGVLMDRLTGAGALDVFYAPIQMKKNRPGTLVTVIASPPRRSELAGILFAESTTIGVRVTETLRERLERESVTVDTRLGAVRVKVARRRGDVLNAAPEFDDCVRLAAEHGVAVKDVQAMAVKAWLDRAPLE